MIPTLKMLGDAAGGDADKFQRIVLNYAQIQSVGKAATIDMKQFAQMGLPVYDLMKKMGVQGNATAQQVTEMFQKMTSAGGTFYNGMNTQSQTLNGKMSTLNDTWKDYKATLADTSGLGAAWKTIMDEMTKSIQDQTDAMNERNKHSTATKAYKNGTATNEQTVVALSDQMEALIAKRKEVSDDMQKKGFLTVADEKVVSDYTKEIESLNEEIDRYNKLANKESAAKSKSGRIQELVDKNNDSVDTAMSAVNEIYKESTQGQKEAIQKQIQQLEDYKKLSRSTAFKDSKGNNIFIQKEGLSADEINKINAAIDTLQKKLSNTKNLSDWQKIMKEVFNFSDRDNKFLNTGVGAVTGYTKRIDASAESLKKFYSLVDTGKKQSEIDSDLESVLQNVYDSEFNALKTFMESGKWDGTEDSIKLFVDRINAAKKDLNDAKIKTTVDKEAESLQNQYEIIGKTGTELYKIQYMQQGIDEKTATELANRKSINEQTGKITGLKNQNEQLQNILDSTDSWADKLLHVKAIQEGITDAEYDSWVAEQKKNDKLNKQVNNQYDMKNMSSSDYGKSAANTATSSTSGDVGTFASTYTQTGNWILAIINTVIGAIFNVAKEFDNFDDVMSPVTKLFERAKPFIGALLDAFEALEGIMDDALTPLMAIFNLIGYIIEVLKPVVVFITKVLLLGHLLGWLADLLESWGFVSDELSDEQEEEVERLQKLNEQYEALTEAINEQEQYYLKKRQELNATTYNETVSGQSVNDMILTPSGNFSTHPDDYIIATKDPSALSSSGSVSISVQINNTASDAVTATTEESTDDDGITQLIVNISKKIASDYASGTNGWDNAISANTYRRQGRSIS
jgi:hypothetical protein